VDRRPSRARRARAPAMPARGGGTYAGGAWARAVGGGQPTARANERTMEHNVISWSRIRERGLVGDGKNCRPVLSHTQFPVLSGASSLGLTRVHSYTVSRTGLVLYSSVYTHDHVSCMQNPAGRGHASDGRRLLLLLPSGAA
jgi:hypothetical protein